MPARRAGEDGVVFIGISIRNLGTSKKGESARDTDRVAFVTVLLVGHSALANWLTQISKLTP